MAILADGIPILCGANLAEDDILTTAWQAQCFVRVGGVDVELLWQAQGIVHRVTKFRL